MKKVNKNSPALRENSLALLCIFSGQTAHSPRHYTRNARITKIHFRLHTYGSNGGHPSTIIKMEIIMYTRIYQHF
jgi:hypothetical protein